MSHCCLLAMGFYPSHPRNGIKPYADVHYLKQIKKTGNASVAYNIYDVFMLKFMVCLF